MTIDESIQRLLWLLHSNGGRLIVSEAEFDRVFGSYDTERAEKLGLVRYVGDAAPGIFDGYALTNAGRHAIGLPPARPARDFFRSLLTGLTRRPAAR